MHSTNFLFSLDTDGVIFTAKKGTPHGLELHESIFSKWASETKEDERITLFVGQGAKNYAYETENVVTGAKGKRVVKIRGLTLSGFAEEHIDIDTML